MKIIIAPDSFKGSLCAADAAGIIARAAADVWPDAEILTLPLADGGEGTMDCILSATGARRIHARLHDPLGRRITADYGIRGNTAVMEMAAASGLMRVSPYDRDILRSNTYGTGEMLQDAVLRDCCNIFIGIGGSATNDGGMGMAAALGVRFLDSHRQVLPPFPSSFKKIGSLDKTACDEFLKNVTVTVLCDVTNPLLGPDGATMVFSAQKNASPAEQLLLEEGLTHYADIVERYTETGLHEIPGSGAAGGLGFGLLAFCHAEIRSGIDAVLDLLEFDRKLVGADLVVTGEGRIDGQTAGGKACQGVARRCRAAGVPCVAVCGDRTPDADLLLSRGLTEIVTLRGSRSIEDAIKNAAPLLRETATDVFRRAEQNRLAGLPLFPTISDPAAL